MDLVQGGRHRTALRQRELARGDAYAAAEDDAHGDGNECGATADQSVIAPAHGRDSGDQENRRTPCRSTGSMGVHMSDAAREEEARKHGEEIGATDEAAAQAAAADTGPSPEAEIAQGHRSGHRHDHTDTAAHRPECGSHRGPRR